MSNADEEIPPAMEETTEKSTVFIEFLKKTASPLTYGNSKNSFSFLVKAENSTSYPYIFSARSQLLHPYCCLKSHNRDLPVF